MPGGFFHAQNRMTHQVASDLRTPVWARFERDLQLRLQSLREQNDVMGTEHIQTAATRGRIAEVKRLLALSKQSAGTSELPPMSEFDSSQA